MILITKNKIKMEDFKGTRGKWYTSEYTDDFGIKIGADHPHFVAMVFNGSRKYEEVKANAQLIATAPELLQALIDLIGLMDCNIYSSLSNEIKNAERVINKALGKE